MRCEVCRSGLVCLILSHGLSVYGNFTKLPFNLKIATDCLGVSTSPNEHHLKLNCSFNEQIAVDYIKYGFKQNTSTQCYEDSDSNGVGECCSTNNTDCFVYKNGIAGDCTGKDNCVINTKQLESTSYPYCNSHLNVSSSIEILYYCVSSDVDSINLADSADQKTSKYVHLQSFMYPEPNFNISTSCSVETECGVSLTATLIESNIQCQNGSARKDQSNTNLFLCNGATDHSLIRVLQYSSQHFLYFTLQEVGRLWVMFSASDSVSKVTVTCGSDAQDNATSICPNITSQGSSPSTTGSSTHVTGSSESVTGSTTPVIGSSESVIGSSESVTGSSTPVIGSSKSVTGSFTHVKGSSESVTESSTPVIGLSESVTGSSESVTGSTTPVIGSPEHLKASSTPLLTTGSSEFVTASSTPVTGSSQIVSSLSASEPFIASTAISTSASTYYTQEVQCDEGSDSNCTSMISTNTTQDFITENINSSSFVDTSMVIGAVSGVIVLIIVIVVGAVVITKKGKQKKHEVKKTQKYKHGFEEE